MIWFWKSINYRFLMTLVGHVTGVHAIYCYTVLANCGHIQALPNYKCIKTHSVIYTFDKSKNYQHLRDFNY